MAMENPLLKGRGRNKNVSATLRDEGNIPFPRIQVLFMGQTYNERERERDKILGLKILSQIEGKFSYHQEEQKTLFHPKPTTESMQSLTSERGRYRNAEKAPSIGSGS